MVLEDVRKEIIAAGEPARFMGGNYEAIRHDNEQEIDFARCLCVDVSIIV